MSQQYTKHDIDLVSNNIQLTLVGDDDNDPNTIDFQFPPRITSDNRKGSWQEGELRGIEPLAVFSTSGPREITLSWYYIVDALSEGRTAPRIFFPGGEWASNRIQGEVQKVRGYFSKIKPDSVKGDLSDRSRLLVRFRMWRLTGIELWTARIISVDVKHGETIVDTPPDAYPLRTDITIGLRIWTTGSFADGSNTPTMDINGLKREPSNRLRGPNGAQRSADNWY